MHRRQCGVQDMYDEKGNGIPGTGRVYLGGFVAIGDVDMQQLLLPARLSLASQKWQTKKLSIVLRVCFRLVAW